MSMTPSTETLADTSPVAALLEQRAQLEEWLSRLDEVQADADARIVNRVRDDYRQRLRAVQDELADHVDSLRQEAAARDEALEAAEAEHKRAVDALEEARLRHRIGELSEADWSARRGGLEGDVEESEQRCREARSEAGRLASILAQIDEDAPVAGAAAEPAPEPRAEPEAAGAPAAQDYDPVDAAVDAAWDQVALQDDSLTPTIRMDMAEIARIVEGGPAADARPEETPAAPAREPEEENEEDEDLAFLQDVGGDDLAFLSPSEEREEDLAFLEELDRAIEASLGTSSAEAEARPAQAEAEGDDLGSDRDQEDDLGIQHLDGEQPPSRPDGVKCPECGYTNNADAWYCGVCGGDLG